MQAQRATHRDASYRGVLGAFHPRLPDLLSPTSHNQSHTDTVRHIAKHDGFRGFYRGLGPTLLGYLPTWAIYFAVYDGIKTTFGEPPLGEPSNPKARGRVYPAAQVKGYQPIAREH